MYWRDNLCLQKMCYLKFLHSLGKVSFDSDHRFRPDGRFFCLSSHGVSSFGKAGLHYLQKNISRKLSIAPCTLLPENSVESCFYGAAVESQAVEFGPLLI